MGDYCYEHGKLVIHCRECTNEMVKLERKQLLNDIEIFLDRFYRRTSLSQPAYLEWFEFDMEDWKKFKMDLERGKAAKKTKERG